MRRIAACCIWIALLVCGPTAFGGEDDSGILGLEAGIHGVYKAGLWTPIRVDYCLSRLADDARLELIVPDGDGVPSRYTTPLPCPAPADNICWPTAENPASVTVYARLGRVRGTIEVCLRTSEGELEKLSQRRYAVGAADPEHAFSAAVGPDQKLVVVVGTKPAGVTEAANLSGRSAKEKTVVVHVDCSADLPDRWIGYEAVDTVVLTTSNLEPYTGLTADSEQLAALETWIHCGGKLLLACGQNGQTLLSADGILARFVPGEFAKTVPLRQTGSLETYAGSNVPLRPTRSPEGFRVSQVSNVRGTVTAGAGNLPLVIEGTFGLGHVVFFAGDLEQAPLAGWRGRAPLVARLLGRPTSPEESGAESKAIMHFGYNDLAGQLRSALDQFPEVWIIPFWVIVGTILVYLLAIGPGDFFLLRKLLGRMELTWVTFPAVVIAFSLTAYLLAYRFKGDEIRLNQVDLVDIDVASGQIRGTAWANLFSPRMQRYNVGFEATGFDGGQVDDARMLVGWLGLPGEALGGMNPTTAPPAVWRQPYDFAPALDGLSSLPVNIWSTKSLTARWTFRTDQSIETDIRGNEFLPAGTITNTLDFPLEKLLLAYGNWAYELNDIAPGESVRLGPATTRRELNSFLTGQKLVFDEEDAISRQRATPYDLASVDPAYILRAMMFFEAAGGRKYTRLSNSYQGFVDLSRLLGAGRAVLMAQGGRNANGPAGGGARMQLSLADDTPVVRQENHITIYRFVIPVQTQRGG